MTDAPSSPVLVELWRGDVLESVHRGGAVACRADGEVVFALGDPARVILPRSACKMLQALPLVESGAADAAGLTDRHLALACASHHGTPEHIAMVRAWLGDLGLAEDALRCGPAAPLDADARFGLRRSGEPIGQVHNNCSGKHTGFLTARTRLGGDAEYLDTDHPVQRAVRTAIEEMAGETASTWAIDGCSAPNFALSLAGLATAMARFATPSHGARGEAAARLRNAMRAHPVLVGGPRSDTTALIRASGGGTVVKSGAEGVFTAILPEAGLGIAVKIDDGADRGSVAATAALLARFGALDRASPAFRDHADAEIRTRRGTVCGRMRAVPALLA